MSLKSAQAASFFSPFSHFSFSSYVTGYLLPNERARHNKTIKNITHRALPNFNAPLSIFNSFSSFSGFLGVKFSSLKTILNGTSAVVGDKIHAVRILIILTTPLIKLTI